MSASSTSTRPSSAVEPRWVSRADAVVRTGLSVDVIDPLIKDGSVSAKKKGRRVLINLASLDEWVDGLEDA